MNPSPPNPERERAGIVPQTGLVLTDSGAIRLAGDPISEMRLRTRRVGASSCGQIPLVRSWVAAWQGPGPRGVPLFHHRTSERAFRRSLRERDEGQYLGSGILMGECSQPDAIALAPDVLHQEFERVLAELSHKPANSGSNALLGLHVQKASEPIDRQDFALGLA